MPTYEYLCQKCDKTFEVFQSMKDPPVKVGTCGKKGRVRRLVGRGAGIIFKGSGFYETDYRRRPVKPETAGSGGDGAGKSGGASAAPKAPKSPPSTPAKP
jgi:putative FmdB family regulatory protein